MRGLARNPYERWESVQAFASAFEQGVAVLEVRRHAAGAGCGLVPPVGGHRLQLACPAQLRRQLAAHPLVVLDPPARRLAGGGLEVVGADRHAG